MPGPGDEVREGFRSNQAPCLCLAGGGMEVAPGRRMQESPAPIVLHGRGAVRVAIVQTAPVDLDLRLAT